MNAKQRQLYDALKKKISDELQTMIYKRIRVGDIYMDCFYHPCVTTEASILNDDICGISLINGTGPRNCSFRHCCVTKMNIPLAMELRKNWDLFNAPVIKYMVKMGWWKKGCTHQDLTPWDFVRQELIKAGFGYKVKILERYL